MAKEKTSELEDIVIESIQSETRKKTEKQMKIILVSSRAISNSLTYVLLHLRKEQ